MFLRKHLLSKAQNGLLVVKAAVHQPAMAARINHMCVSANAFRSSRAAQSMSFMTANKRFSRAADLAHENRLFSTQGGSNENPEVEQGSEPEVDRQPTFSGAQ